MYILIVSIIASIAFVAGYILSSLIRNNRSYSGSMKVVRSEGRILYSLELDEDPSMLEYKREVVFKVETSDESSNRK